MRRTALVFGLAAMLGVAACGGTATPSSDVSSTQIPSSSAEAAASGSPSLAPESASPVTSPSTPASAAPSASSAPSPTPSPTPTAVCTAAMLTAKVSSWEGAMGSQIATVRLTNASSTTCQLRGTPGLQLVDAGGHILMDSKTDGEAGLPHVSAGDKAWLLETNGWITTMVRVSNYCGAATPVLPTTVAFILPSDGGRLVAAAGPGGSVPPCLGSPGDAGSIAMNGWAH